MTTFSGKVAAVTGAGSGIGRALAVELAAQGCHLAIADVDRAGLDETAAALRGREVSVTTTVLDVADETAVQLWASDVVDRHGRVDAVFNNAGVGLSGTVAGLGIDQYRWIMDINFWGVVFGTKAFLPYLEVTGGQVVNTSSVWGLTALPLMSGYNASKYAVRGFTDALRQDLELTGSRVSATCVYPGGIKTNMNRSARIDPSTSAATGRSDEDALAEMNRLLITSPERAAQTILRGVARRRRRVLIGPDARFYDLISRIAPAGYQSLFVGLARRRSVG
ncbi:SDR family NAD(P)-dependent oxidoreductase [Gordonia sp. NPDC003376]